VILLVENDSVNRYALARILRNEGHEVIEAADGDEALDLLEKSRFDLVITDLVMPKLNGFELVAQIRSKRFQVPIILISAFLSEEGGKIISGGNAEFMQKPVDPANLMAAVRRLLT
jgi:CheY-like chemotaxis protein